MMCVCASASALLLLLLLLCTTQFDVCVYLINIYLAVSIVLLFSFVPHAKCVFSIGRHIWCGDIAGQ